MVFYKTYKVAATTTTQALNLSGPLVSVTAYADTSTVQFLVAPSDGSDFQPINNGGSFTWEPNSGAPIAGGQYRYKAASSVDAYFVVGYP